MTSTFPELVAASSVSPDAAERPRLLLVEDDDALRRALTRTLSGTFNVTAVADGSTAAELLLHDAFDSVLSDIGLPGMSGVDLLRLVRSHDIDTPVVLMTGHPTVETAVAAMEAGALTYVQKPFAPAALREALLRAANLARLTRARREAAAVGIGTSPLAGDRMGLAKSFERALDSLTLVFQPIVDRRSRKTMGFEALMRTAEPSMPNPGALLEAAERLGCVEAVGRRVRELASSSFEPPSDGTTLFVNLHPADLLDPDLYDPCAPLSKMADMVVLEITERSAIDDVAETKHRAAKLRQSGYRLAIDDLGAGYAGLTSFATLEPEVVKLDMSLIREIHSSPVKKHVVESMTRLCRDLDMRVVAEGIETMAELATVIDIGCDYLQGYFLGRPAATIAPSSQRW